jgi:PPOX class probable F420-dependent enzyme
VDLLLPRTFSTQLQEVSRKQSCEARRPRARRTISDMPVPAEIKEQKYISLATLRKNGIPVPTPVWFGEKDDKLYVMTRSDSGKYKRIRNNPKVRIAPCTMRGKITGPEVAATARILPPEDWPWARKTIERKYWLTRIPFFWSKKNVYLEIEVTS